MIRNFKALGLALVAMLALGAFAAQGASASPFTCGASPATCFLTGDQDGAQHEFVAAGGTIKCTEAIFTGSPAAGTINEITVTPSYPTTKAGGGNNCTAFGFASTHVITNGCTYTFTTPTSLGGGKVTWDPTKAGVGHPTETAAQIHLVCPGNPIEITPTALGTSVCTETIEPQTPTTGHVVGENAGNALEMDVTLRITLEGIHYKGTGSSCGDATTHIDGKLTGNSTVRCFTNAAHTAKVDCTFS